jgi:hypothetical protein
LFSCNPYRTATRCLSLFSQRRHIEISHALKGQ